MVKIQFISAADLKNSSVLQANVDEKTLNIAIREFQELELDGILSKAEYTRLSNELIKVQNGTLAELSESDKILFEYITPVMIYGSLMYSISPLHRKLTNSGVKEDVAESATSGDPAAARADYAFKLDGYKGKLLKHIASTAEVPVCSNSQDTTFNFTGVALPDDAIDGESFYRAEVYKGY